MNPYACSNKPRPNGETFHVAQDGWVGEVSRVQKFTKIMHVMSTECKYDISATDPRCSECEFKKEVK